ncbi:MAG: aminoacyl-tRNA hydrolase [Anaerolineaceae bacterium]|nr:aminoacyl-tRNA hydrolase [Anaerolineaceae bacterium]
MSDRWLIVGLGNLGRRYERTRHNVGWFVLDELARRHALQFSVSAHGARLAEGRIRGHAVILAKPQGYMNRSGQPTGSLLRYWRIETERLLVVLDDLDQPAGALRIRPTGGAGGQRGLQDIIDRLGTRDFSRLRLGIGRPPGRMEPRAWVLKPLRGDDLIKAQEMVGRAADAVETWLQSGTEAAMIRHNGDGTRALARRHRESPEESLERWQRAQELNPGDPGPPERIGRTLLRLNRTQEAVDWMLRAAALHDEGGDSDRSLRLQEQALKLDPSRVEAQRLLAAQWLALGNPRVAARRLWTLAQWLARQARSDEALSVLDDLLELNGSHGPAARLRAQLREVAVARNSAQTSER